ncbi:hypothetical protein OIV83_002883 [Microbotryomycetes sp. JL201]|nr:hypothetical protein OIV83_002883 [Microbotryomycetes sp. JL201]
MSSETPVAPSRFKFKPKRKTPAQDRREPSATPSVDSTAFSTPVNAARVLPDADDDANRTNDSSANNNIGRVDANGKHGSSGPAHLSTDGPMKPPPVPKPAKAQVRKAQPFAPGASFGLSEASSSASQQASQSQTQLSTLGLSIFTQESNATQDTQPSSQPSASVPPPSSSPRAKSSNKPSRTATAGKAFTVGVAPPQASPTRPSAALLTSSPARASALEIQSEDGPVADARPASQADSTVQQNPAAASKKVSKTTKRKAAELQTKVGEGDHLEDVETENHSTLTKTTRKGRVDKGKGKSVDETPLPATVEVPSAAEPTTEVAEPKKKRATRRPTKAQLENQNQSQSSNMMMSLAIATQVVEGEIDREEAEKRQEELQRQRQMPKKRGRPKKIADDTGAAQPPKKRGRPKRTVVPVQDEEPDEGGREEGEEGPAPAKSRRAKSKARENLAANAGADGGVENGADKDAEVSSADDENADDDNVRRRARGPVAGRDDDSDDEFLRRQQSTRRQVQRRGNAKRGKTSTLADETDEQERQGQPRQAAGAQDGHDAFDEDPDGETASESEMQIDGQSRKKERAYTVQMITVDPTQTTLAQLAHARDDVVGRLGQRSHEIMRRQKELRVLAKEKRMQRMAMMKKRQERRIRGQPSDQETDPGEDESTDANTEAVAAPGTTAPEPTRIEVAPARLQGTGAPDAGATVAGDEDNDDEVEYNSDDDPVKRSEKRQRALAQGATLLAAMSDDENDVEEDENAKKGSQAGGDEDDEDDEETFQETSAVQMRMVDGKLVIDTNSLTIDRVQDADLAPGNRVVVEEDNRDRFVNYSTHSRHARPNKWTAEETELFYEGVRQFGTDFEMIAGLFPDRDRAQIKKKWTKEDKMYPQKITAAFNGKKAINLDEYSKRTGYELSGPVPEDPMDEINARRAAEETNRPANIGGERSVSVKVKKRETTAPESFGGPANDDGADDAREEESDEEEEETELERLEREEAREREIQAELAAAGEESGRRKKKKRT